MSSSPMTPVDWTYPTRILLGCGRVRELPALCRLHAVRRPLVVSDPGVAALPFFPAILAGLRASGTTPTVFAEVLSDPDATQVSSGAEAFVREGCDGVIAIGGGSVLDAAKAIALRSQTEHDELWSYKTLTRDDRVALGDSLPPVLTVPTTSGTGSEVNGYAVISCPDTGTKISLYDPGLLPRGVIADPELTVGLPPSLTAATGFDALSHNLEALSAPGFFPVQDAVARSGISFALNWLGRAIEDGSNLEARAYMMTASMMGAIAFEKGLGAMHAIAHSAGSLLKVHHGELIATLMPFVLDFNRSEIERKLSHIPGLEGDNGFEWIYDWVQSMRVRCDVPTDLGALGAAKNMQQALLDGALADVNGLTNPVPLTPENTPGLLAKASGLQG